MQNGNPVGSLSENQQSLIVGSLLGDGYMRCKTNAHLQMTHSIHQKEYVNWKYLQLRKFVITPPKSYKGNGSRVGYRFFTRSLPTFTPFYHRFYKNRRKLIPKDLYITPLTLAVWYMDDGSKSRNACYLNTQQFTQEDQKFLISVLQRDFNLSPNLNKDKQYTRLRFTIADSQRLAEIIRPHVITSMQYKFPI
jgi:hypothetical protein